MKINAGQAAPGFDVKDIFGRRVSLQDFQGKKLMISFYRYAACPLCNLRVHQLIAKYPEYQKQGLEVIAFFQSPVESIRQYVGKQDAPFPIVGDPERKVYKRYGVEGSWWGFLKGALRLDKLLNAILLKGFKPGRLEGDVSMLPADFLIGPSLGVVDAYYGKDISDHISFERIDRFLGI